MTSVQTVARRLAVAIAQGRLTQESVVTRATSSLGRRWRWLNPFAKRVVAHFGTAARPPRQQLLKFILADEGYRKACGRHDMSAQPGLEQRQRMVPTAGPPQTWKVPPLTSTNQLAGRLNLTPRELLWWADPHRLERHQSYERLRHYWYGWRAKRDGTARLIESPKQRLKSIQRWMLREILEQIPAHPAAHGFRQGRSVMTYVEPHVRRHVVLKMDLRDFFPGIARARVVAIFMTAGYPEPVAELLAGLCVNSVPMKILRAGPGVHDAQRLRDLKNLYYRAHLPQGAPTSPAVANLAAYRLDCRLAGLAAASGAIYTRYADDLAFSGDAIFASMVDRFVTRVGAIALEEGFEINMRKTRVMRPSIAQRCAGLILNERINIPRRLYDELKAIVHNCLRHGPTSQNRDHHPEFAAHLSGRISQVEQVHPARGARLRRAFDQIDWGARNLPK